MQKTIEYLKERGYQILMNYKKVSKGDKEEFIRKSYFVLSKLSIPEPITHPKPKLIIGKERSGKSFLANNISFGFSKPIILNGKNIAKNDHFMFSAVEDDTDLILIDDVPAKDLMQVAFNCVGNIYIERRGQVGFEMQSPQVIINSIIDEQYIDASIMRRFEVIKTHIEKGEDDTPVFYAKRLVAKK